MGTFDAHQSDLYRLREVLRTGPNGVVVELPEVGWLVSMEREPGPHDGPDAFVRAVMFRCSGSLQNAINPDRRAVTSGNQPDVVPAAIFEALAAELRRAILSADEVELPGVGLFRVTRPRRGRQGTNVMNFRCDETLRRRAQPRPN